MLLGKSNGTSLHVHTVDVINTARALKATALNEFPGEWWEGLFYAALLHDLGKIETALQAVSDVLMQPQPPKKLTKKVCARCAYYDFCFA